MQVIISRCSVGNDLVRTCVPQVSKHLGMLRIRPDNVSQDEEIPNVPAFSPWVPHVHRSAQRVSTRTLAQCRHGFTVSTALPLLP